MQSKTYLQQGAVAAVHANQPIITFSSKNEVIQHQEKTLEEKTEKKLPLKTYSISYGGWMGYRGGYEGL